MDFTLVLRAADHCQSLRQSYGPLESLLPTLQGTHPWYTLRVSVFTYLHQRVRDLRRKNDREKVLIMIIC